MVKMIVALIAQKENEIMVVTKGGTMCRQKIENISTQRRVSQGVRILKLDKKDEVVAMSQVKTPEDNIGDLEAESTLTPKTPEITSAKQPVDA